MTQTPILDLIPASHRDLLTRPLTAGLTTLDSEGRPQATAVWFLIDDGLLKGSITAERQKFRNLRTNPACVLLVIDPDNTQRTLEIRADAVLTADVDKSDLVKFAKPYGVSARILAGAGNERWTITFLPRRIVVNPPPARS